jgi:hypothetical protein
MPVLFPLCLFFVLLFILVFVVIEILGGFVAFTFGLEFNGIDARDRQRSSTFVARKNVPFVQFFFFHIDGSITLGTIYHEK